MRTKSTLGLSWSRSQFTGGAPILDYRLSVSQGGQYSIVAQNLTNLTYTVPELIAGLSYQFVVESRTVYGLS